MSARFLTVALFAALVATGCDQRGPLGAVAAPTLNAVAALDTNVPTPEIEFVSEERADIELLKDKFNVLKDKLDELAKELQQQKEMSHQEQVTIDFSKETFTTIKTPVAEFFISPIDAQPYLDGYKLTLHIGNPTSARFSGVTLKVKWGALLERRTDLDDAELTAHVKKWLNDQKSQTIKITESLLPGKWNKVEIVAVPATAEGIRNVRIQIEVESAFLTNPTN
jgi:hypothetical protein